MASPATSIQNLHEFREKSGLGHAGDLRDHHEVLPHSLMLVGYGINAAVSGIVASVVGLYTCGQGCCEKKTPADDEYKVASVPAESAVPVPKGVSPGTDPKHDTTTPLSARTNITDVSEDFNAPNSGVVGSTTPLMAPRSKGTQQESSALEEGKHCTPNLVHTVDSSEHLSGCEQCQDALSLCPGGITDSQSHAVGDLEKKDAGENVENDGPSVVTTVDPISRLRDSCKRCQSPCYYFSSKAENQTAQ